MVKEELRLIKCWGDNIESNGIESKKYLSYIINKNDFTSLSNDIKCGLNCELEQLKYIEVIYNQITRKINVEVIYDDENLDEFLGNAMEL